jgi:hypothetical protein
LWLGPTFTRGFHSLGGWLNGNHEEFEAKLDDCWGKRKMGKVILMKKLDMNHFE